MGTKPEEKAMVTSTELQEIKSDIYNQVYEREVVPLKERLELAIEAVQAQPIERIRFKPPTKVQIMEFIAPGCQDEQIIGLFIAKCNHLQLNPLAGEIYLYDHAGKWVTKIDYKVPIAIAHQDPDFLKIETGVEYTPHDKRPAREDKTNPWNIEYGWCRLYRRSAVKLAAELGDKSLGYEEYRADWKLWRRLKKDGNLFSTWKEKGPFYIEKTAIDHLLRRCYKQAAQLPPSTGYDLIRENGVTPEDHLLKEVKQEQNKDVKGKIDPGFSKAPGEEQAQEPKSEDGFVSASIPQVTAIGNLVKALRIAKTAKDKVSQAEGALADHEAAALSNEKGMSHEYAAQLIKDLQDAVGVKK